MSAPGDFISMVEYERSLAHRISTSLTAGTVMLAFALALVFVLIVHPGKVAERGLGETAER